MENSQSQQFYNELNKFIDKIPCNFQIYVQMHELKQQNIYQITSQSLTLLIDLFANHLKSNQLKLFLLGIRTLLKEKCTVQVIQQQKENLNYFQIQQNIFTIFSKLEFKNKLTQIQIQIRDFIKSINERENYEFLEMVNNFSNLNEKIKNQINEFEVYTQIAKIIDQTIQEYIFTKLPRFLKYNLDLSSSSTSIKKRKRDESYKFDPNDLIDIKLPPKLNQSFEQNINLSQIDQVMQNDLSFESDNQIILQNSQQKSNIINQNVFEYRQIQQLEINSQNQENQKLNDEDDDDYELAIRNLFENLNVLDDDKTQIKQEKEELKESIINQNDVPVYRKLHKSRDEDCLSLNYQDFYNFNRNAQNKQFPCKLFTNLFDIDLYQSFIHKNQIQVVFRVHPDLIFDYLKLTLKFQNINALFEEVNVDFLKLNIENQKYFFQILKGRMTDQEFKQKQQNHKQYLVKVSNNPEGHNIDQYFQCIKCKEVVLIKIDDDKNDEFQQYLKFAFPKMNHVDRQLIGHYLKHVVIVEQKYHGKHNLSQQIYQRDQINPVTSQKSSCQIEAIQKHSKRNIEQKFKELNQNYYINDDYDIHFISSEHFYSKIFEGNYNFNLLSGNQEKNGLYQEHLEEQYIFLRTFGYYSHGKLVFADTRNKQKFYQQLYADLVEHLKCNKLKQ